MLLLSHPVIADSATWWTAVHQVFLSLTISQSLPKFMFIVLVMTSSYLILWCPLLLCSIFPSIRVFSNESAVCIRWPKYWNFRITISPFNEYSGLISFRIDWFDLLAVHGTLKSLLQHHGSKASIIRFFMVQFSHLYMITGKTTTTTIQTINSKMMSLLFNTLSRFVMGFPGESVVKNLPARHETQDRSLGWGRPSGGGQGNPLHYSCLENAIDKGAWWAMVHWVTKSQTQMKQLSTVCHSFPSKKQSSSNSMTAVTIHRDSRAQEEEIFHCFHLFLFNLQWRDGTECHFSYFNIEF